MLGSYAGGVCDVFQELPGTSWCWCWGWEFLSLFLRPRRTTKNATITSTMTSAVTPPTTPVIAKIQTNRVQECKRDTGLTADDGPDIAARRDIATRT